MAQKKRITKKKLKRYGNANRMFFRKFYNKTLMYTVSWNTPKYISMKKVSSIRKLLDSISFV